MTAHRPITADDKEAFLAALREMPNISRAARLLGREPRNMRYYKANDPAFSEAWDEALKQGIELMEEIAHKRAFYGTDKPLTHQGQLTYQRDFAAQVVDPETGELRTVAPHEAPYKRDANNNLIPLTVAEVSDTLIQFMLKAHMPEKYRERQDINVTGSIDIATAILEARKRTT